MAKEEKPKKEPDKKKLVDEQNKLVLKLNEDDSALIVRTNGEIELISRELQNTDEETYIGDLEDLNKTFTLVLAFAAARENEQLYNHIFQNLNHVLHRQWSKLPPEEKDRIKELRLNQLLDTNKDDKPPEQNMRDKMAEKREWLNRWKEEIERGRHQLEEYMNQNPEDRDPEGPFAEMMQGPPRRKRKKKNPLLKLKGVKWNPYDDTLKANFKSKWQLDAPPDEEDE